MDRPWCYSVLAGSSVTRWSIDGRSTVERCQSRAEKIFEFGPASTRIARKRRGRFNRLNIIFRFSWPFIMYFRRTRSAADAYTADKLRPVTRTDLSRQLCRRDATRRCSTGRGYGTHLHLLSDRLCEKRESPIPLCIGCTIARYSFICRKNKRKQAGVISR